MIKLTEEDFTKIEQELEQGEPLESPKYELCYRDAIVLVAQRKVREWADEDCDGIELDGSKHAIVSHGKVQRKNCHFCWRCFHKGLKGE